MWKKKHLNISRSVVATKGILMKVLEVGKVQSATIKIIDFRPLLSKCIFAKTKNVDWNSTRMRKQILEVHSNKCWTKWMFLNLVFKMLINCLNKDLVHLF